VSFSVSSADSTTGDDASQSTARRAFRIRTWVRAFSLSFKFRKRIPGHVFPSRAESKTMIRSEAPRAMSRPSTMSGASWERTSVPGWTVRTAWSRTVTGPSRT
jgi:hypothetical protein